MMKKMMLGVALAAAFGGAAAAQDARPANRVDVNADRRISLAEMQSAAAARFARTDANRDGQLTRDERRAARQAIRADRTAKRAQRQSAVFARRDRNGDGVLAQAEAPKRLQAHFAHFDANRDGGLTAAELQAGRQSMAAGQRAERKAERKANRPARAKGDGVVTLAEMQARVSARFARLDANRDGFVTRDERRAGRAARRA